MPGQVKAGSVFRLFWGPFRSVLRLAKRAVDCALVIGFGAAYGAGRLIRLGWLQFFFKPEDAVQLLDWFTLIVDPAGRMPFYFYDIPAMTSVRIETH